MSGYESAGRAFVARIVVEKHALGDERGGVCS